MLTQQLLWHLAALRVLLLVALSRLLHVDRKGGHESSSTGQSFKAGTCCQLCCVRAEIYSMQCSNVAAQSNSQQARQQKSQCTRMLRFREEVTAGSHQSTMFHLLGE